MRVFIFTATATTAIYTLSLHDALPIYLIVPAADDDTLVHDHAADRHFVGGRRGLRLAQGGAHAFVVVADQDGHARPQGDRKSTRLNSSHSSSSYAVFCLQNKR